MDSAQLMTISNVEFEVQGEIGTIHAWLQLNQKDATVTVNAIRQLLKAVHQCP